jgi:predicted DNA-binding protein (MmcQ/YjbR family)
MNVERAREFLLGLPHVVESEQWGGLVFWVGDKHVGGKMFVMLPLDGKGPVISYPAGQERFGEVLELEGMIPAPYMARIFWVSAERWDVFRRSEWEDELHAGHALVFEKLPPKVKATLELPKAQLKVAIAAGKKRKAEWEAKELVRKAGKKPARKTHMSI